MTDDDLAPLVTALVPIRDVCNRMMTIIEQLTTRVEVLELERLHEKVVSRPG